MKKKTEVEIKPECINTDSQVGRMLGGMAAGQRQAWDAMEAWMTPEQFVGFLRGNAIKYLARADDKGGLEDIKKAQHYIDKLVEFSEGQR